MKYRKKIISLGLAAVPSFAAAQFDSSDATSLFSSAGSFINRALIPTLILLALLYVVYAAFRFIVSAGNSQEREQQKQHIFWGIIGLFVIVSVWGLVAVVANSFGIFAGGSLG